MTNQKALITAAGAAPPKPAKTDRKALTREIAHRLRSAKDDDEATEALEAIIELARSSED